MAEKLIEIRGGWRSFLLDPASDEFLKPTHLRVNPRTGKAKVFAFVDGKGWLAEGNPEDRILKSKPAGLVAISDFIRGDPDASDS